MQLKIIDSDDFHKHLDGMVRLYNTTFKNKVDRSYFLWRYIENPQKDLLISLAIDGGRVVSSYSYSPMNLRLNETVYKSALAIHLMTHPDYKGLGLSAKLCNLLAPSLAEKGYKMVRGFPNQISHTFHVQQLGWVDIFEFPTMSRPVTGGMAEDPDVLRDDDFQFDYSGIMRTPDKIRVDKTIQFMQWRYTHCPTVKYLNYVVTSNNRVRAYAVVKKYDNKINIVDHFYDDVGDMERLLAVISKYAVEQKAEFITTWANINTGFKIFLDKQGFQPNLPITYFGGKLLSDDTPLNYEVKNWDVVMGDDNVY